MATRFPNLNSWTLSSAGALIAGPVSEAAIMRNVDRVVDNRDELRRDWVPDRCPDCGGLVVVDEVESRSWDREGWTTWLSLDWYCRGDPDHYVGAPIAFGRGS